MNSRLQLDPHTNLPSIHSFGELSQFLRSAIADEDSRQFSDGLAQLAVHVEAIVAGLRLSPDRASLAPQLMDLMTVLRDHRALVVNLPLAWRGLYEYASYLQALNNFRVLIGQWLLHGRSIEGHLSVTPEDFELVAWRTLGEGMLLIDMYEQWLTGEVAETRTTGPAALSQPQVERALQWWQKLRL